MLKEELERILGMAPRDNYVTQKPTAITYMKEGKVVPAPVQKKVVPPTTKPAPASIIDPNILGKEAMKLMAPSAPERSNYVEALPQDIAIQKKVTPEKLEQIKKQFRLAPVAKAPQAEIAAPAPAQGVPAIAPQEPVQQYAPRIAPTETPREPASINETIDGMKEKTSWGDILPALAPLLAGAVMGGGTGVASGVAGDYLLSNVAEREKRNKSLEDKLLAIEQAKAKTTGKNGTLNKRFQRTPIWDPESQRSVYANYDTVTGEMYHLDGTPINTRGVEVGFAVTPEEANRRAAMAYEYKKKGIDYMPRMNPETGLPERAGGRPIFQQTRELNPSQLTEVKNAANVVTKSKSFQEARTALSGAEKVKGLLALNSPSSLNSAKLTIVKMGGNVGATSDKDLELVSGDPSALAAIKRTEGRLLRGEVMLDSDREDLKNIAEFYARKARRDIIRSLDAEDKRFSREFKTPEGTLKNRILPQVVEVMPNTQNMVRVMDPNGKTGWMPKDKLEKALKEKKNFKVIP